MLPAPRTRRARAAALTLALAAPILAATASPAFASGESASAVLTSPTTGSATTFTWSYNFSGTHGLSNIAIGFCSADILADVQSTPNGTVFTTGDVKGGHDGFGPGIKFDVTAATGSFTVTFAHEHAIGTGSIEVQSHSGDGTTGDAITPADGPSCPADQGGTSNDPGVTNDPGTSNDPGVSNDPGTSNDPGVSNDPGTSNDPGVTNDPGTSDDPGTQTDNGDNPQPQTIVDSNRGDNGDPSENASQDPGDPAPTTEVLGVTVVNTDDPAPALTPDTTTTPAVDVTPTPAATPAAVQGTELARTGAGDTLPGLELGFGLLAAGLALRASTRRQRSAPSAN